MPGNGLRGWPIEADLRPWQQRALAHYHGCTNQDYLLVASPGAGKTRVALRIGHDALFGGIVDILIIVVPTNHLEGQWAKAAAPLGLALDDDWANRQARLAADMHGIVVTYQQVAANPRAYRALCERHRALIIFDEIHHAAEGKSWGDALRQAFDRAVRRLLLSGTPFRSDNNMIPYVRYTNGHSQADFYYDYGSALAENVCRPILFPSFEGEMKWIPSRGSGMRHATFADDLSDAQSAERLKTALSVQGNWLPDVLRKAHARLLMIRQNGHPDAGGLVIAIDQDHARAIVRLLKESTGEEPEIAISDEPDASARITRFTKSTAMWLVTVRMVSEGVDISRLRVLVYATNVTDSEGFFRQAVARVVRMIKNLEEQIAYVFFPRDPKLLRYAQQIKDERDHQIDEACEQIAATPPSQIAEPPTVRAGGAFMPVMATAIPHDVIFESAAYSQTELAYAEAIAMRVGLSPQIPVELLARALREHTAMGGGPGAPLSAVQDMTEVETLQQQKRTLRRAIQGLVARLAEARGGSSEEYGRIRRRLYRLAQIEELDAATLEQLQNCISHLQRWSREERRES